MNAFPEFFASLWRSERWPSPEPFPWQTMLAERGATGQWPEAINLPTASGKTACLDAAVFALAATSSAEKPSARMPRRIWFVVDRRIVVDEAFDHATALAAKLKNAKIGVLGEIAERLRSLSGTKVPIAVARLRGGAWRDDGWARLPAQPAIICSTVDQVGSSLLFRAYGRGDRTASVYAGLAAHDSLILLDEAHCAVPFLQTLRAIARFRSEKWAEEPLQTPFRFTILSATPPADIREEDTFPRAVERSVALNHKALELRLTARKLAKLIPLKKTNAESDQLMFEAARRAKNFAERNGIRRVAVMLNRVATAEATADRLRQDLGDTADVVLLTGRMRPLDRDTLVETWKPLLKAGATIALGKPVILVTTQCLEVGADFSFDALVTECASLDALRQRFGRLDRLGTLRESAAAIFIRERDTKEPKDEEADPIYGKAIFETWKWLSEPEQKQADDTVDFRIEVMDARVAALRERDENRFVRLLAPTADAPVLLPAHLDLLCQTAPRPAPEPDISLFLHGKGRRTSEVRVVFRADLPESREQLDAGDEWLDTLSFLPPTSPEMLTVPLHRLREWLAAETLGHVDDGDVEGTLEPAENWDAKPPQIARTHFLLWRGRNHSAFTRDLRQIRPDDVVVLPARLGMRGVGQEVAAPTGLGAGCLDLAERAVRHARGRVVLRLQPALLAPWVSAATTAGLRQLAAAQEIEDEAIRDFLRELLEPTDTNRRNTIEAGGRLIALPEWVRDTISALLEDDFRTEDHPNGGFVLTGKRFRPLMGAEPEDDPFADDEDFRSSSAKPQSLRQHLADVRFTAREFARRCLPSDFLDVFDCAAVGHDWGKLDSRFQLLLNNGDESAATGDPLAKSARLPERRRRRVEIREDARLPDGFRHEILSVQLADYFGLTPDDPGARELTLHLIASHHGHARPFVPVVADPFVAEGRVADVSLNSLGIEATLTATERRTLTPAHRLDSGISDRFWRLTRRFGWWGLAYLEAIFRLSDWQASREPGGPEGVSFGRRYPNRRPEVAPPASLSLDALDGANPLAFLAALGTLRLVTRSFPEHDVRLAWKFRLGAWRPLLSSQRELSRAEIVTALSRTGVDLRTMFSPELLAASEKAGPTKKNGEEGWKDKLRFPTPAYRRHCEQAVSAGSHADHVMADYAAAWAGESATDLVAKTEVARRTRFDFTAGNQALIDMFREVKNAASVEVVKRSLFDRWTYLRGVSLRWDPQDEKRQWALQAIDPKNNSKNPPLTEAGANFLAVEALPLFPLVPDRWASQPGFDRDAEGRSWRWPIWTVPLSLNVVRALLTLPLADAEEWPPMRRRAMGVDIVFRSTIVQPSGRYRCFTPAQTV